jgi:hypothetical protein
MTAVTSKYVAQFLNWIDYKHGMFFRPVLGETKQCSALTYNLLICFRMSGLDH